MPCARLTDGQGQHAPHTQDSNPLHYVVQASRQVLSTPVRGATDLSFNPSTGAMHIGLLTLRRAPWWRSMRSWAMALLAYFAVKMIGRGKALDILSSVLLLS
jgi:hypothetical protein